MALRNVFQAILTASTLFAPLAAGCGGAMDHDHEAPTVLAAPTDLEAMAMNGGVHLTWEDNSADEDGFMIMRRTASAGFASVGFAGPDVTYFHDGTVSSGRTYTYAVHAVRAGGNSPISNETTVSVP